MADQVSTSKTENNNAVVEKENQAIFLYNITKAKELLSGLRLAVNKEKEEEHNDTNFQDPTTDTGIDLKVSDKMFCSYCNNNFTNREEQTDHYKGDWHRFNLKQKLKAEALVTEKQFEELIGGTGNHGDVSSISGSDTDSDVDHSEDEERKPFLIVPSPPVNKSEAIEERYHVEGEGRRHPKVFFHNKNRDLLAVYRCVLYGKKNQPESEDDLLTLAVSLPDHMTWAVLMTAGGHFAGAVFEGEKIVVHKTFHRYVIRAKRGTVQSTRDGQGNAPRSAGASLRRHNEVALTQEIQETLDLWADHLGRCDRIFMRGPSSNKGLYFGGKKHAIVKNDPRLRTIPFPTRRPTYKEVQRVHGLLATLQNFGPEGQLEDHFKCSPKKTVETTLLSSEEKPVQCVSESVTQKVNKGPTSSEEEEEIEMDLAADIFTVNTAEILNPFGGTKKPKSKKSEKKGKKGRTEKSQTGQQKEDNEFDLEKFRLRNELYTSCKTGDKGKLEELLKGLTLSLMQANDSCKTQDAEEASETEDGEERQTGESILNECFGDNQRNLLHIAAIGGKKEVICTLLEAGVDPSIKDRQGKVPYALAPDKPTRNEFRHFMGKFPEKYNYMKAQIPAPLDEESAAAKKAKEAEKKKLQHKARKEKLKEQKAEDLVKKKEEEDRSRFLGLSDREKRALAAEKRLLAQCQVEGKNAPVIKRCFQCGVDMTGKIPFEYYDFQFCTTKCLREHKTKNAPR